MGPEGGLVLRRAAAEDAAALARFSRDSFEETFGAMYPSTDLQAFLGETYGVDIQRREILDPDTDHLLAWRGPALCGFVKLGLERTGHALPGRPALELHRLYVAPAEKGAGTAGRLMDWAITQAKARGARDLTLSVFSGNHRARRFYARYGFRDVAPYVFRVGSILDDDVVCRAALDA